MRRVNGGGMGQMGVSLVDVLDPTLPQQTADFEQQLTQKLVVTFFAGIVAASVIVAMLDRGRRG